MVKIRWNGQPGVHLRGKEVKLTFKNTGDILDVSDEVANRLKQRPHPDLEFLDENGGE